MKGCRAWTDEEIGRIGRWLEEEGGRYWERDRALVVMGLRTGFRVAELLSVRVGDVWDGEGCGRVKDFVAVRRREMKGGRAGRVVPLHEEVKRAVEAWVRRIPEVGGSVRGEAALFQSRRGVGRAIGYRQALGIVQGAAEGAGVTGGRVGTHSMRKTFAVRVYERSGRDLMKTRAAMGHESVQSTISYLETSGEEVNALILEG